MEPPSVEQLKLLLAKQTDFIAIGLQEVKSQPQNIINDAIYEDSWTNSMRYNILKSIIIIIFVGYYLNKLCYTTGMF